ncbi:Gfo/Idh/MocA family protein [Paenibacillus sp. YN15]|uniref:Gfo/Idh/MocA family protein n=1 Tax=Paenibacillus sp. YN15 TaxID=1742774 RepID=UPI000DCD6574|nr:Gfo/Idh/MocA family oxidoreductase [Paenibacillus sp. YN15]RAV04129.1 gfo/Idh/MocA family oxidoreductase [Paenibacillus sp. YN15]
MAAKVGIVGLGDIAQKAYLPVLAAHDGVEIAGVMSRSAETVERIGRSLRVAGRYTSLDRLLGEAELDAVFVHSPTETHYSIVMQCLQAGVHVYVDKPLSYDIGESEELARCARETGKLLAVGFNRRFAPLYVEAKAWMEAVGGFRLCTAEKHRTRQQKHGAKQTLYDDLIHMMDLVLWLSGETEPEVSYRQQADADGRLLWASGRFVVAPGQGEAAFSMVRSAGLDLERLELHGGGRSARVVNLEQGLFAEAGGAAREAGFGSWEPVPQRRGFTGAVEHFLASLSDPAACSISADKVLPVHRLIERL